MRILGLSAFYHDSAAALLQNGAIVSALQEERFTRKKHDSSLPVNAVKACLQLGNCQMKDLDYVVFYEKPFSKFERLLETYLKHAPRGLLSYLKAMPLWIKDRLWMKDRIRLELNYAGPLLFADHHEAHAAAAFYPSPFQTAAIYTVDGVGEWTTTALGSGRSNEIELTKEIRFPHSIGLLYSTFTYFLGFKVNSGEYKVMGLAPYGNPRFYELIRDHLIAIGQDGSFRLNLEFFDFEVGLRMPSPRLYELFGKAARRPQDPLTPFHHDVAASIQKVTEDLLLNTVRYLFKLTGEKNLCMAGGVALNCVANGRILREGPMERIWVQPASGDAGGSLGAALAVWHQYLEKPRTIDTEVFDKQKNSLLGTRYDRAHIEAFLTAVNAVFRYVADDELFSMVSRALADGAVVGWFQGRMEFGPRALGNRSILADPRQAWMLDEVNRRIKYRESFRPFAPAVLVEKAHDYFDLETSSPYMLLVSQVLEQKRSEIPAVTHVDGSARIQTVDSQGNPRFHRLLLEFLRITGCPVLLNTSFNVRGEPIVESPADAYRCFMRTGIDMLVLGNCVLLKTDQPTGL